VVASVSGVVVVSLVVVVLEVSVVVPVVSSVLEEQPAKEAVSTRTNKKAFKDFMRFKIKK